MKDFIKRENIKIKVGIIMFLCLLLSISALYLASNYKKYKGMSTSQDSEVILYKSNNTIANNAEENSQLYLSDIDPIEKSIGYSDLKKDKDMNGNLITLKVENNLFAFEKGVFAHAKSTLVYDLTSYNDVYKYFVAFIGLNNTAASSSNGVIYHFYTSNDKQNWEEVGESILKKPGENATYVEIPLNEAKYLKIYIDDNGKNGNDHSVFADAKLVKTLDNNFVLDSVEDYDTEIKSKYLNQIEITDDLEFILLKRELIKNVGQYTINSFYNASEENAETINWLMNNKDVLRYYILGGTPTGGSYYNSLSVLAKLYEEYSDDFNNTKLVGNPRYPNITYGDLYLRMAVSISLTHSTNVGLWMQSSVEANKSEPLRRYAIFKYLYKNGGMKITDSMDKTHDFEELRVPEMRILLINNVDDESILWLNRYVQDNVDKNPGNVWRFTTPHPYISYVWPNYGNPVYYDPENADYFNELFSINKTDNNTGKELVNEKGEKTGKVGIFDSEFTIPGGKNIPSYTLKVTQSTNDNKVYKVWMNFRNKFGTGAVCGGISKSGANIRGTHGIPAMVIGQPGHAALLFYTKDELGRGYWRIDNDVSGWTLSGGGAVLLGWGAYPVNGGLSNGVYIELEQAAVNDYDNLVKAEQLVKLASTYSGDLAKQEEIYRKAISIQNINFDAWLGLIEVYNQSTTKTEDDYYNLVEEIAQSFQYYPLPMYNLTNLLQSKLTSNASSFKFTLLQTRTLTEASTLPNNTADSFTVMQPGVTRVEANFLLGKMDKELATFSFDGADAGKIVLSSRFDNSGVRWDYSLDGKKTWNEVSFTGEELHKLQLSQSQINSITEENDIYVHIVGVDYEEKNLYKIDITQGALPTNLFANDLENRIVGVNLSTQWRYNEQSPWVSYSVSSPDLTGNKTVQIRQAATGTKLASDVSEMYTFTLDNQPDTRKYIPVSHLSIQSVSTQAVNNGGAAVNAIDGNYNTRWHSAWNGTDQERFIVIKLDKSVSLSAVEFVPCGGGNGKIYDGTIYGSMDGKNWEELVSLKNLTYTNAADTVDQAIANTKSFEIENPKEVQYVKIVADRTNGNWFTARAFNLYQDITKNPHPTAGIAYSTTNKTNGKVVARLINPSTKITITNNNGSDSYIFSENGEFTFEFVDENGKVGSAVAKVNWIDKSIPTADITYNLDNDKKMVILLENISEDVYLLDKNNNKINYIEVENGKVTTISYLDASGNIYKMIDVDENGCITKITYKNTSNKVTSVATYVTIVKNGVVASEEYYDKEGNSLTLTTEEKEVLKGLQQSIANPLEYTFESSGEYEFKLLDKASNIAYKSIKVDYVNNIIIASDITYDNTRLTNQNVVATIHPFIIDEKGNKKEAQMINSEKNHVFTENGEFIFKYKDSLDTINYNVKTHTAKVSWIDKKAPTAQVKYETKANGEVVATLVNESETILLTNNNGNREYTFTQNGEFTFEFEDLAGNKGSAVATVNSISKKEPEVKVLYSTLEATRGPVLAILISPDKKITITNNDGKNTYTFTKNGEFTFEYIDEEGTKKTAVARVTWIINTEENPSIPDENHSYLTSSGMQNNNSINVVVYNSKPRKNNTTNKKEENKVEDSTGIYEEIIEEQEKTIEKEDTIPSQDNKNKQKEEEEVQKEKNYEEKSTSNKFKNYALEFVIIGLLISGIIIVKARRKK